MLPNAIFGTANFSIYETLG